jgi:hypothetical protein
MSIILDTLRSYAARTNDRQNGTTNTIVYNQRKCKGWDALNGDGTSLLSSSVTFPFEFDDNPIVTVTFIGAVVQGTKPTSISELNVSAQTTSAIINASCHNISKTGFDVSIVRRGNTMGTPAYYAFSWTAEGTYNEYE